MMIVLCGIDASGKNTQSRILTETLKGKLFSFPAYETTYGNLVKDHLQSEWLAKYITGNLRASVKITDADEIHGKMVNSALLDAHVFQALQLANRMELAPALMEARKHSHVVLDRYWPSGYVYGSLDGIDRGLLFRMHQALPQPDLFLLLDVDSEMSAKRRPERRDRYEKQDGLMADAADRYRQLWAQMGDMNARAWEVIDGRGPIEQVSAAIMAVVKERV